MANKSALNQFIKENVRMNENERCIILELEKIQMFLLHNNIEFTIDDYIKLLKENEIVYSMVSILFERKVYERYNDEFILSLNDAYCIINDITLEEKMELFESPNLSDNFKTYLMEIKRYPLLTPEEEKKIALKVSKGDNEAKKQLVECNLRLVASIARRYAEYGIEIMDIIQDGNSGLLVAAEKYDITKGCKFATYATYWINSYIRRGFAKNYFIYISNNKHAKLSKYKNVRDNYIKLHNEEPTREQMAQLINMDIKTIAQLEQLSMGPVSMNRTVGYEYDNSFEDVVDFEEILNDHISLEKQCLDKIQRVQLVKHMKSILNLQELRVMVARYGFLDGEPKTLKEIGEMMNVSHQRVRQVESKALSKLKNSPKIIELYKKR